MSEPAPCAPSMRMGFVKFVVRDLDAMADFYRRALGLEVVQTLDFPDLVEKVMQRPGEPQSFSLVLYFDKPRTDGIAAPVKVGTAHGPLGPGRAGRPAALRCRGQPRGVRPRSGGPPAGAALRAPRRLRIVAGP